MLFVSQFPNQGLYSLFQVYDYTPETGFLYSSRIITDSVQETRFLAIYIYMEYAVLCPVEQPPSNPFVVHYLLKLV